VDSAKSQWERATKEHLHKKSPERMWTACFRYSRGKTEVTVYKRELDREKGSGPRFTEETSYASYNLQQ